MRWFHKSGFAAAGCAGALVLAACGAGASSGAGTGTAAAGGKDVALEYSRCMRAHGVTNFPDPGSQGGIQINPSTGVNPQSPVFQSAQQACAKLGPGGGPGGRTATASQRRQALAFSECMRARGVTNFPDPIFPAGGGILIKVGGVVDPNSPVFKRAQAACGRPGL